MARFSLDFCLTFLPGCCNVPAADAVMLFVCQCPSTITAWFLTYPLVRCRGQLACRSGTISVAKGVNFRDHATDRWSNGLAPAVARLPDCWYRV